MRETLDFIVIGAQKAGTSSVFEHLREHPDLYLAPEKDHPFFSHNQTYADGWPAYMWNAFRGAQDEARWGAVTVGYMMGRPVPTGGEAPAERSPGMRTERIIPERIRAQVPGAKLIAILRDPVARCVSHYGYDVSLGSADRGRFDETIDELLTPSALERCRHQQGAGFVVWGEYGRILAAYYEVFPREQIHVCFTSDLERAPREFIRELFGYLDVDPDFVPAKLHARYRRAASSKRIGWLPSPAELERKLARQNWARSLWQRLPAEVQTRALMGSREANHRFRLWNRSGVPFDRHEASPETLERLRVHYERDRGLLEEVIGRPVPWGEEVHRSRALSGSGPVPRDT
jgi:sulfotransferase family protein